MKKTNITKQKIILNLTIIVLCFGVLSCKHTSDELFTDNGNSNNTSTEDTTTNTTGTGGDNTSEDPCDPDLVYFQQDVLPILVSSCAFSDCHDASTAAEGVVLDTYENTMATGGVRPSQPSRSELYEVLVGGEDIMPPSPYSTLSTEQKSAIYNWILQGAENLSCKNNTCDTSGTISFAESIEPIINNNCKSCHSNSLASGGVSLASYAQIKTSADNGSLYGTLVASGNYPLMPTSGSLSDCDIALVKKWIDQGAENN